MGPHPPTHPHVNAHTPTHTHTHTPIPTHTHPHTPIPTHAHTRTTAPVRNPNRQSPIMRITPDPQHPELTNPRAVTARGLDPTPTQQYSPLTTTVKEDGSIHFQIRFERVEQFVRGSTPHTHTHTHTHTH